MRLAPQLSAAEAQAKVAGNATRYAELLADADGIVMETLAEPGQVVGWPARPWYGLHMPAHAKPWCNCRKPCVQQSVPALRPSSSAGKTSASPPDSRQLSDVADHQTRTFEARYVLEGELSDAPLGTTITVQISDPQTASPSTVQVPIAALYDAGNGPGIWMMRGEPVEVAWTPVNVQSLDDESARVSGAIKPGDQIVALGAHLLHDGQAVRLRRAGHRGGSQERPA
ncbi:RND efflux pump membrane fusion protein barrel-sandwich domain-containing protein [Pseudomonas aeruginosa]